MVGLVAAWLVMNGPADELQVDQQASLNPEIPQIESVSETFDDEDTSNDDVDTKEDIEVVEEVVQDTTSSDSITSMELLFADTLVDDVDDIIILEDRLVGARMVDIRYVDESKEGMTEQADSALEAHLDIRHDDRPDAYEIEFWNSPINYSGYRLGKNKLILFGIGVADTIALYGLEETVYLSTPKGLYELNRCDQFEKLRIIVDEDFVSSIVDED